MSVDGCYKSHIAVPTSLKCEPPVAEMCPPGCVFGLLVSTLVQAVPVWSGALGFGFGAAAAVPTAPTHRPADNAAATRAFRMTRSLLGFDRHVGP